MFSPADVFPTSSGSMVISFAKVQILPSFAKQVFNSLAVFTSTALTPHVKANIEINAATNNFVFFIFFK